MTNNIFVESTFFGLGVVVIGLIILWLVKTLFPHWNVTSIRARAIILFISGFVFHMFVVWSGIDAK